MILDTFENAKLYKGIHPGIDRVLEEVLSITPENFPSERIVLDQDKIFMNAAQYKTHEAEDAVLEAHRLYIDVMCMIDGEETIYVKNTDRVSHVTDEYTEEAEALLAKLDPDCTAVRLKPGSFCILFPQDAHAPGCVADTKMNIKKIIGKVKI